MYREDTNIKNHFYSSLRKVYKNYSINSIDITKKKELIKSYYIMLYVRNEFKELKKMFKEDLTGNNIINIIEK